MVRPPTSFLPKRPPIATAPTAATNNATAAIVTIFPVSIYEGGTLCGAGMTTDTGFGGANDEDWCLRGFCGNRVL
jgi:hypothetical protein